MATNCKLSDLFVNAEEELPEFFNLKSDIFTLHPDGQLSLTSPSAKPKVQKAKKVMPKTAPLNPEVITLD